MRKNYIYNITSYTKIYDFSQTRRMRPLVSPLATQTQIALATLFGADRYPERQTKQ
jgi:hypothetical protein